MAMSGALLHFLLTQSVPKVSMSPSEKNINANTPQRPLHLHSHMMDGYFGLIPFGCPSSIRFPPPIQRKGIKREEESMILFVLQRVHSMGGDK